MGQLRMGNLEISAYQTAACGLSAVRYAADIETESAYLKAVCQPARLDEANQEVRRLSSEQGWTLISAMREVRNRLVETGIPTKAS